MPINEYNDTPLGLILPPPDPLVKDEPEEEGTPEPPEMVVQDNDPEDYDMHDNDEAMEELIASQTEVKYQI